MANEQKAGCVEALLPCPFCGSAAMAVGPEDGTYCVRCSRGFHDGEYCWAAVGENYDQDGMPTHMFGSAEDAAAAWNQRAALEAAALSPARSGEAVDADDQFEAYCATLIDKNPDVQRLGERLGELLDAEDFNAIEPTLLGIAERLAPRNESSGVSPGGYSVSDADIEALLPGTLYMDPPDGGSVTLLEQLQRMAEDAAKYRTPAPQDSVRVGEGLTVSERQEVEYWRSVGHDQQDSGHDVVANRNTVCRFIAIIDKLTTPAPAAGADKWQERCLEIGFKYWRAPDAHGVECTHEQALELLRDVLGVEVDFVAALSDGAGQSAGGDR
jgi:hypothetical protein